jgi:YNFM family putative membrane transporter
MSTPIQPQPQRLADMSGFLLAAGAMFATMYCTQAILPEIGRAFDASAAETGLTLSVLVFAVAAGALLWGPLAERLGRPRALTLASLLLVAPTICVALAPTLEVMLVARALQGLCMPGLLAVGVPYVAEVFVPALGGRAMGFYNLALIVGGLAGRLGVGLATAWLGWRGALALVAVLPAGAAILLLRRRPPDRVGAGRAPRAARAGVADALRDPTVLRATAVASLIFFAFVATFSYVPFRLAGPPFNLDVATTSLVFGLWLVGLASPLAGHLADVLGWRTAAAGAAACGVVGAILSSASALPLVVAGLGLVTLAQFAGLTAAQLGLASAPVRSLGAASAVYFSTYYLVGGLAAFLPGYAWEAEGWASVVAVVAAAEALALAIALAPRRHGAGVAQARHLS